MADVGAEGAEARVHAHELVGHVAALANRPVGRVKRRREVLRAHQREVGQRQEVLVGLEHLLNNRATQAHVGFDLWGWAVGT